MVGLYVIGNLDRRTDRELPLAGLALPLPESRLRGSWASLSLLKKD